MGGEIPQLKVRIGCVVLAVIMSAVTYYFVEPRLRWGRYGGYKAIGLLSAMIVVGVAGYSVESHEGYVGRVPTDVDVKEKSKFVDHLLKTGTERFQQYFPDLNNAQEWWAWRILEKEEGRNNIALFGDSHANALLPGLLLNEGPRDGIISFVSGCGIPFMGVRAGSDAEDRFPWHKVNYKPIMKGFEYVLSHPEIKRVILTNFPGCFQFWGIRSIADPTLYSQELILADGISRTFKALSDGGKEVVYVLDVPTFSKDGIDMSKVTACASKLDSFHRPTLPLRSALYILKDKNSIDELCTMSKNENGSAMGHELLKNLVEKEADKYQNIHVVDLSDLLCDDKTCSMRKNGKMLYSDSQHLNRIGAAYAATLVLGKFEE